MSLPNRQSVKWGVREYAPHILSPKSDKHDRFVLTDAGKYHLFTRLSADKDYSESELSAKGLYLPELLSLKYIAKV